jgi:hypothetical protein
MSTPLADRLEITDLVSRLGRWLDRAGDDAPERVLAPDVTVRTPGGEARGIERVVAQAQRNHAVDATQHVITDVVVDVDGDRAAASANLVVTFVDGASLRTLGERYRFGAARTNAGWRLSRIEVDRIWER